MEEQTKYTIYFSTTISGSGLSERRSVGRKVSQYFSGFTMIKTRGYWNGEHEVSNKLEIITKLKNIDYVIEEDICDWIKKEYNQEEVLMTKEKILIKTI